MSLSLALVLSLAMHAALLAPPWWSGRKARPTPAPVLEARLAPVETIDPTDRWATRPERLSAPPPPTPPAKPPPAGAVRRAQAALSSHLFYPEAAAQAGLEGETVLLLELDDQGRVERIEIVRSSGHALLDQAALAAARKIGALPGNPRQTLFPVSFRLQ